MVRTIKAIITIARSLRGADRELTRSPYWLILDPVQNMRCSPEVMAQNITGPFFSRKEAQAVLESGCCSFSPRAIVYCLSGNRSNKYRNLYKALTRRIR